MMKRWLKLSIKMIPRQLQNIWPFVKPLKEQENLLECKIPLLLQKSNDFSADKIKSMDIDLQTSVATVANNLLIPELTVQLKERSAINVNVLDILAQFVDQVNQAIPANQITSPSLPIRLTSINRTEEEISRTRGVTLDKWQPMMILIPMLTRLKIQKMLSYLPGAVACKSKHA